MADFTIKETLNLISEAASTRSDKFKVRIMRRLPSGGLESIAILTEAKAVHLTEPETWLGELAGGGNYLLHAFHMDEPAKTIGGMIEHGVSGPSSVVNDAIFNDPNWRGPRTVFWIEPKKAGNSEQSSPMVSSSSSRQLPSGLRELPADPNAPHLRQMEENQRKEKELLEEKSKFEVEKVRSQFDLERKKLEAEADRLRKDMNDLSQRQSLALASAESKREQPQQKSDLLAPALPLLGSFLEKIFSVIMEGRTESAKSQIELQKAQLETQLKIAEMNLKNQERQEERFEKLLATLQTEKGAGGTKAVDNMIESFGRMANTTMSMAASAMEMREQATGGASDVGAAELALETLKLVREFVKTGKEANSGEAQKQLPARGSTEQQPSSQTQTQQPAKTEEGKTAPSNKTKPLDQSLSRLELMVKQYQPAEKVALAFFEELDASDEFASKADNSDGVVALFGDRLASWFMTDLGKHKPYMAEIEKAIDKVARDQGRLEDEPQADKKKTAS